jgi:prepilin-type N-terminal cleavage/methylation domain-containing protein
MSRPKHERREAGFTLIELMMAVAIVGVLAALGMPALIDYIWQARTVEATGFMSEVRVRQESYRFDTGLYFNISAAWDDFFPSATPTKGWQDWRGSVQGTGWGNFKAMPEGGGGRFVYSCVAGTPTTVPNIGYAPNVDPPSGGDPARGYANIDDVWFITIAVGDLADETPEKSMQIESYSHTKAFWFSTGGNGVR